MSSDPIEKWLGPQDWYRLCRRTVREENGDWRSCGQPMNDQGICPAQHRTVVSKSPTW